MTLYKISDCRTHSGRHESRGTAARHGGCRSQVGRESAISRLSPPWNERRGSQSLGGGLHRRCLPRTVGRAFKTTRGRAPGRARRLGQASARARPTNRRILSYRRADQSRGVHKLKRISQLQPHTTRRNFRAERQLTSRFSPHYGRRSVHTWLSRRRHRPILHIGSLATFCRILL
jgi:hypothetical protein